ncbi:MAG: CDP-alcohol phosphatidyltransferase [Bacteroidia bacterium]|nr:MAG: CDP-alcohol phosphatidyltransferase [Bacteroidia bacterium]
MAAKTWTLANAISGARLVLLAPLAYCLFNEFEGHRLWAAGIVALGALSDFADGFLARRLHEVSELGKVIDPIADKVGIGVLAIFLVVLGDIPLWYVVVVLVRDILILSGGLLIKSKKGIVVQSNWPGKIAVSLIAGYLLLSLLRMEGLTAWRDASLWSSVAFMTISLGVYARRLFIGRKVDATGRE